MTAEDLRKSILQQAIQGKLVPQDPNDEPAAVLLERIREEKARLIKEKKIKKDKNESIIFRGDDNSYYEKILATGEVKCIDEEIPFEIPESWEWSRFGCLMINRDCERVPLSSTQRRTLDKLYDYYGASGIIDKVDNYLFDKNLLLIGEDGANLINRSTPIAFIATGKYWVNNHAHVLDVCGGLTLEYISLYINAIPLTKYVTGTAQPKMNQEKMNSILVSIPPIQEQLRIVNKIDCCSPIINNLYAIQQRLESIENNLYPQLRKSLLQYAIQGKLIAQCDTDEPATELLKRIHEERLNLVKQGKLKGKDVSESTIFRSDDNRYYEKVGSIVNDITDEIPYELPETWSFVRLSSICYLDDGIKHSGEKLPYMDAKFHRGKGDITYLTQGKIVEPPCKAILVDGENSGEIFNITERGYIGSTFKILRIANCISEEWLHLLLDAYRDVFKNSKVGAAIPHLNKNLFRNLIIGLPPYEEQVKITEKLLALQKSIEG